MTTPTPTAALVLAARSGDRDAFGALVARHERACLGYARVLLADPAAADDAVQDAFVDAWLHLHQLREPQAFAGWLRRAVFKHCDRQRRRAREVATADPIAATPPTGPEALDEAGRWRRLRAAIEALPEHERVVVALYYLGGASVLEIAAFLEVSEPAVKKRLFSARQRLNPEEVPVSVPAALSDHVSLFLALRAGDAPEVRRVLRARPELVHAEEGWTDDEALAGGFPLAHPLAPTVLASALGDLPLVQALLDAGAAPDGRCACDNGESALWAAARHGHADVVQALLAAGADPAIPHGSGLGLADLAAWRDDDARLTSLAARHGLVATPRERPVSAFAVTDDGAVHTGIGALDLWAPLRRHDLVRLEGAAETGLTVLLSELAWAVGAAGGRTLWTSWVPRPWHARELQTVAARGGVERRVEVLTPATTALSSPEALVPAALARLAAPHDGPVVHVVFEQEGHAADLAAHLPQLAEAAALTVLVRPWAAVTRGEAADEAWAAALDARITTDRRMAALGLWPAIDPLRTRAHRDEDAPLAEARALVEALGRRDPTLRGDELEDRRARRLLAVLTQPFHAATPDTGWAGASWSRAELDARVADALAGRWDEGEERALRYRRTARDLPVR